MKYTLSLIAFLAAGPGFGQNVDRGEVVFKKCKSCHQVGAGAKNRAGPILTGVIGRQAGSAQGYNYSKSMRAAGAGGLVWDEDRIFAYLEHPTKFLRAQLGDPNAKAKMSFRLKGEQDRRDVIAFLSTFGSQTTKLCVHNGSDHPGYFVAEIRQGERRGRNLRVGETLCVTGDGDGVVSAFENETHLEGCSRLVAAGKTETLLRYVDFDRCAWQSNS